MSIPPPLLAPIAAISGIGFALIGIAYRMGQPRGIAPPHIVLFLAAGGTIFFGVQMLNIPLLEIPLVVIVYGTVAGLCQYVLVKVIKVALRMGPLSPVWCALALSLLPTIGFASVFLGEKLGMTQVLAIVAGIACVLAASAIHREEPAGKPGDRRSTWLAYVAVLLLIPTFNCISQIGIKHMEHLPAQGGGSLIEQYKAVFLMLLYLMIGAGTAIDLFVTRGFNVPFWRTAGLGLMAAAGSIFGMAALTACAALPAATLFTLSNVVSILATALVATLAFGERRTLAWYGTVGFGVLTVVVANLTPAAQMATSRILTNILVAIKSFLVLQ